MKKISKRCLLGTVVFLLLTINGLHAKTNYEQVQKRSYNGAYEGANLNRVAFPIGGIGSGMIALEGTGAISHVSVRHHMEFFHAPCTFAALCIQSENGNIAKILEGPVPHWKIFGQGGSGSGSGHTTYGLPRFEKASFLARFPFGIIELADKEMPVEVKITGWNPFIPGNPDDSSLPAGSLEYQFTNKTNKSIKSIFSFNTRNFMAVSEGNSIKAMKNGFILWQDGSIDTPENEGGFAIYTDEDTTVVDHCWFRGGWFDSLTLTWDNIQNGVLPDNPPVTDSAPGASLFVPITIAPHQSRTVRLMMSWYVPKTRLRHGQNAKDNPGPAFGRRPSGGTADYQQAVSGFLGQGLVNTYDPAGDSLTGRLISPEFQLTHNYLQFLIGGGLHPNQTCINLIVDGAVVRTATGNNKEALEWTTWDIAEFKEKQAKIEIVDENTEGWGHILVDQIILCQKPFARASETVNNPEAVILHDFESETYKDWIAQGPPSPESCPVEKCVAGSCGKPSEYYFPWYACHFASLQDIIDYWSIHYERLRFQSTLFKDAFYDTNLPGEVVEAVAANLTILKSPTVLRQTGGRLWCWEGCSDNSGCCPGSCTHVWNYAQAVCHLFPSLERSLRETEFFQSQNSEGHQTFRSALPIRQIKSDFYAAADGQLGGIMKVYREWRISGDTSWMKKLWPQVKQSLDYCIRTWDPRGKGILEEPHHNTYDIEYWGPDGHCGSFYLGALTAAIEMGKVVDEDTSRYQQLLADGRRFMETELFDGEYFYQKIQTEGLNSTFQPLSYNGNGKGYQPIIEMLNQQGPKYQYGKGCLSDGILGFWIARTSGLEQDIVDPAKIRSHLNAIYTYNFKPSLFDHVNPQRPTYAMGHEGGLLLCTWPKGGKLALPFVYSNEVWTGIEYQAASHLMFAGMVDKGLDIVRACRNRYDGSVRNPFDEYECGHWYGRALSSYGLIQGLTGVRYDAVSKTLYIDSKIGNSFKCFLSTETGFGTVGLKSGKPFINMKYGQLDVQRIVISGKDYKY
jgi:uncharacterized protein (DUF608 family)